MATGFYQPTGIRNFFQPNNNQYPSSSGIAETNSNEESITKQAQQKQKEQEDKADQQNNFLAAMAQAQLAQSLGLMDPWSALGIGVGGFLSPVAYNWGKDTLARWGILPNSDATGANSMDTEAINNSIDQYSTHRNPNELSPISEKPLRYGYPENNFKNNNLLWDAVSDIPFVQQNYLDSLNRLAQDQKNREFLNRVFPNNSYPFLGR